MSRFDQPSEDTREFGIDPDDERCECGVGPLEPCAWYCHCDPCLTGKGQQEPPDADGEDHRGSEAAAFEREQQIDRQALK